MIENFNNATQYARDLFSDEKDMLSIKEYGILNNVPIITDEVLNFMLFLVKNNNYKTCLEIGTAIGYSSKYLAKYIVLFNKYDRNQLIDIQKVSQNIKTS